MKNRWNIDIEFDNRWRLGIKPGLERIGRAIFHLSPPDDTVAVSIAGTNGKGSVARFLESILTRCEVKTGLFTSPHLVSARERVLVGGASLPDVDLEGAARALGAIEDSLGFKLTGFEWIFALAAKVFWERGVDIAIFEAGLGGRLDATNAIDPDLTVITPIAMDHENVLGRTPGRIAAEKAGLIRPGKPVVLAAQVPEAMEVLQAAATRASPLLIEGRDFKWAADGASYSYEGPTLSLELDLRLPQYQYQNLSLAIAAAECLTEPAGRAGQFAEGISETNQPGRFQLLKIGTEKVLMDVAHNPHAAEALAASFEREYGSPAGILVAAKADKDLPAMLKAVSGLGAGIIVCGLPGGRGTEKLASVAGAGVTVVSDPDEAMELLLSCQGDNPALCFGSHHLVGYYVSRYENS